MSFPGCEWNTIGWPERGLAGGFAVRPFQR